MSAYEGGAGEEAACDCGEDFVAGDSPMGAAEHHESQVLLETKEELGVADFVSMRRSARLPRSSLRKRALMLAAGSVALAAAALALVIWRAGGASSSASVAPSGGAGFQDLAAAPTEHRSKPKPAPPPPPPPPPPPAGSCSNVGQDCRNTKCCTQPGHFCFAKDQGWAACHEQCAPGIHMDDAPKFRSPWSCELLSKAPALHDRYWMMCDGPGACEGSHTMHKWHKDPRALARQVGDFSKLPGAHMADHMVLEHWRAAPPTFRGKPVELSEVARFARELLESDPFGTGDKVPYVDFEGPGENKVVAITQRQLAFLVANSLMGNSIPPGDGLEAALKRCSARGMPDARWFEDADDEESSESQDDEDGKVAHKSERSDRSSDAMLFKKRRLGDGVGGVFSVQRDLVAAARGLLQGVGGGKTEEDEEEEDEAKHKATKKATTSTSPRPKETSTSTTTAKTTTTLTTTGPPPPTGFLYSLLSFLAVLSQELTSDAQGSVLMAAKPRAMDDSWRTKLKNATLAPPTLCLQNAGGAECALHDFMAGGNSFQAMTDIAGGSIGGGAGLCDIATTQEESVVQFYSEVLAFSFFAGGLGKMLPAPVAFLGTRRYMTRITGQSGIGPPFFAKCGYISGENWLNDEISSTSVSVRLGDRTLPIAPGAFVGVASKCARCHAPACSVEDLVNNNCDAQRHFLDEDVARWYQAYEATMYHPALHGAFRALVKRVGTGPWGAGEWLGDSQQSFLAVWLATSLLKGVSLDYYAYSRFCENAANQCLVLDEAGCKKCLQLAYPWPGNAGKTVSEASCSGPGLGFVVQQLQWHPAEELHNRMAGIAKPPARVFNSLLNL